MPSNTRSITKYAFYFNRVAHPSFFEVMTTRPDIELKEFVNDSPYDEVDEYLAKAHAYQIDSGRAVVNPRYWATTDEFFERCPNLLMLSTGGAGYDPLDLDACNRAGVIAFNQTGLNKEAVAEHVLGMILTLSKEIVRMDRLLRRGGVLPGRFMLHDEVMGKTLGIIGLGNVGGRLAEMAGGILRMKVLAYDPFLDADTIKERGGEKVDLDDLLSNSDYVSVNCPLNPSSEMMLGAREFGLMKKGAYFVITARGGIVDEGALYDAVKDGHLAGAGLDVWLKEPPEKEHPLLSLDNVVATPHSAGSTHEARVQLGTQGALQLIGALDGVRPPRLLNPESWDRFVQRYAEILGTPPAQA
jgi:D-3-phosphoglycerate dehydrogenase